ncbi:MAG TPA: 30S ribosomal protein S27ae [archaeon]|nr:30S ribosomal protein S27ae [archaeon]
MAEEKGKAGAIKKEPKQRKGVYYKVDGGKLVRKKICPKCGPGVFMAQHEKRAHCGKCGYTEFK